MVAKIALALLLLAPALRADDFPPNGLLVCSDQLGGVLRFNPAINHYWGLPGVDLPRGLAFGPDGVLYVVSAQDNRIHALTMDGGVTAVTPPSSPIVAPDGLAIGPRGHFWVGKPATDQVLEFDADGTFLRALGAGTTLASPTDLAFGPDGHLYVVSAGTGTVQEIDPSGAQVRELGLGSSLNGAGGVAVGPDGRLYVSSTLGNEVVVFDGQGQQTGTLGAAAGLSAPSGVVMGPNGHLFVVSEGNGTVVELDTAGAVVRTIDVGFDINDELDFAPFRFSMKLKGTLARNGLAPASRSAKGVLSLRSGLPTVMMMLDSDQDEEQDSDSLAALFGSNTMVLRGIEAFPSSKDKKHRFHGEWQDAQTGVASLQVAVTGKRDKKTGNYELKSAKGTFVRAGPAGIYRASVKTGKKPK